MSLEMRCTGSMQSGYRLGENERGWPMVRCVQCGRIIAVVASSHMHDLRAKPHKAVAPPVGSAP